MVGITDVATFFFRWTNLFPLNNFAIGASLEGSLSIATSVMDAFSWVEGSVAVEISFWGGCEEVGSVTNGIS